jgi:hypothetical protein
VVVDRDVLLLGSASEPESEADGQCGSFRRGCRANLRARTTEFRGQA